MLDGGSTKSKREKSAKFDDAFCENLSSYCCHYEEARVSVARRLERFDERVVELRE